MKAYKILKNELNPHLVGRLYTENEPGNWVIAATPTQRTILWGAPSKWILKALIAGTIEEVDLLEQKWIHPHLLKNVREKLLSE